MTRDDKLWGGRFEGGVDPTIHDFTAALGFDRRLAAFDLEGSMAHARMLWECGVLGASDAAVILEGLGGMLSDLESGELEVEGDDEDIHSWIERMLTERVGEPARRLHTARSRNDQTATALRLWVRARARSTALTALDLVDVWSDRAGEHLETWLPGYTHLQRGQPVSLAHHLLAHVHAVLADVDRLLRCRDTAGISPLGAGALAATPHPIDPQRSAELLGMDSVYPNSMLAVADRDYVLETAFTCALSMTHLSRWAAEVVLWTSSEFGFARLDDSVAKGSSIMPQKRNPEPAELLRGKTGRVVGDLTALLVLVKGLPLTYMSDLQEDKESLFDAVDTLQGSLQAAAAIMRGLHFKPEAMAQALRGGFLTATDLADYLVRKGTPFRNAHHDSGRAVQLAESRGLELWELDLDSLVEINSRIEEDVFAVLDPEGSARARDVLGGPAPSRVGEQLEAARRRSGRLRSEIVAIEDSPIRRAWVSGALTAAKP